MKRGDETDEAETHNQNHRRRNLQTRCIISVESQHVASSARSTSDAGGAVSGGETATTHAGCGSSGAAWCGKSASSWTGGCGG